MIKIKICQKLWRNTKWYKNLSSLVNNDKDDYDDKYMGIRFDSNGKLPFKNLEMYDVVIIIRFMFNDINKYY